MTTLGRVQAFYWSVMLGSQEAAAERLHVTPTAITKRLHELQAESVHVLFHASNRGLKLTAYGRQLLTHCETMVAETARLDELRGDHASGANSISIGLTELTVMTWFGAFIARVRADHPALTIVPHVDLSGSIRDMLQVGKLDIAILHESFVAPDMASLLLGTAKLDWVCQPGLVPAGRLQTMQDLSRHPIIDQGPAAGLTTFVRKIFDHQAPGPMRALGSSSLGAMSALVEAGLGIACMPSIAARKAIREGRLQKIRTRPAPPSLSYYAVFHPHHHPAICGSLADLARQCFHFKRII